MHSDAIERRLYLSLIKRGDVVIDGGANTGFLAKLFCGLVGREGEVHAFEPFPPTFNRLAQTTARYSRPPLFCNNSGLGDSEGEFEFTMPAGDAGQTSLRQHSIGSWANSPQVTRFQCAVTTLDNYARESELKRLDFLKLDIEGAELLAIRGGRETLKRLQPLVYFELFPALLSNFGFFPTDLFEELEGLGYSEFWIHETAITELPEGKWRAFVAGVDIESVNVLALPTLADRTKLRDALAGC